MNKIYVIYLNYINNIFIYIFHLNYTYFLNESVSSVYILFNLFCNSKSAFEIIMQKICINQYL